MQGRRTMAWLIGTAVAAMAIPAGASAEVLFDQIDQTSPQSINSQDFNASNDAFDALAADDFVIPAGETWQIDAALARGTSEGSTPATSANVTIFADAGGVPGAAVFSGVATATEFPRMQLSFAGPTLTGGTYWFGVSAILDPGTTEPFSQWYWAENSEPAGSPAMYRNPGNGFNTGCTAFTLKSSCVFAEEGAHLAPGQSFSLSGTRTLPPAPPVDDGGCEQAQGKLAKAKAKLKKAKEKLADAEGDAAEKATKAVKKAKARVKSAKAAVKEACR